MKVIPFEGTTDIVRVEDYALSADEVRADYAACRLLTKQEQQTLAALRYDAQTGPQMFADAVAIIGRLLLCLDREEE